MTPSKTNSLEVCFPKRKGSKERKTDGSRKCRGHDMEIDSKVKTIAKHFQIVPFILGCF